MAPAFDPSVTMSDRKKSAPWLGILDRLPAVAIALIGVLVRVPNLRWGLPEVEEEALPMKKAMEMWGWETGRLSLDPQTAGWPSLSFYVHLAAQKIQYAVGRLQGEFADPYDFYVAYTLDPTATTLWARWVGVLASAGMIYAGARLATRLAGGTAGVWVGSALALSPVLVSHAQMVTPDILLTVLSAFLVVKIVDIGEHGRARDYVVAGIFAGLGTAAKYTPVLLTLSIYGVHLLRRRTEGQPLGLLGLDDRRLGYAALATVLGFCVASPYTFASLDVLQRDFGYQVFHMKQGHFGSEGGSAGFSFYIQRVLSPALGWPGLLISAAALGWAAFRERGPWLSLVVAIVPFYLVISTLQTHFDRYMLPVIFPLGLGLAAAWSLLRPWLTTTPMRLGAAAALMLATLWLPVQGLRHHHQLQSRLSTQQLAKEYIEGAFPAESTTLAMEMYSPQLRHDDREQVRQSPVFAHLNPDQRSALLSRPFYQFQYIPLYSARVELSAFYYDLRHYLPYDFVVTSGSVRRRYERQSQSFPRQVQFYKDLDHYAEIHRVFAPEGKARGPEIRIYRFTDSAKRQLLSDKGKLRPGFYADFHDRLHGPHFFAFLESTAGHALFKNQFEIAELYYQASLETIAPEHAAFPQEQLAFVKLKLDKLPESETLYRRTLQLNPRNAVALGNLGYVRELQGDHQEARDLYRRCVQIAGNSEAGAWARNRLEQLPGEQR